MERFAPLPLAFADELTFPVVRILVTFSSPALGFFEQWTDQELTLGFPAVEVALELLPPEEKLTVVLDPFL